MLLNALKRSIHFSKNILMTQNLKKKHIKLYTMAENLNFRDYLQDAPNITTNQSFSEKSKTPEKNTENVNLFQTYSQGVMSALNDKSQIRWNTFFISIPLGLFPWIFGLLGINSVPDKYIASNCSYEFIKGYKSKKKNLKFLPSFICWLTFTNIFYILLFHLFV